MKLIKVTKKDAIGEPAPIQFDINSDLASLIKQANVAHARAVEWIRFLKQAPEETGMDPKEQKAMADNVDKVWSSLNSVKDFLSKAATSAANATKRLM